MPRNATFTRDTPQASAGSTTMLEIYRLSEQISHLGRVLCWSWRQGLSAAARYIHREALARIYKRKTLNEKQAVARPSSIIWFILVFESPLTSTSFASVPPFVSPGSSALHSRRRRVIEGGIQSTAHFHTNGEDFHPLWQYPSRPDGLQIWAANTRNLGGLGRYHQTGESKALRSERARALMTAVVCAATGWPILQAVGGGVAAVIKIIQQNIKNRKDAKVSYSIPGCGIHCS
ncbi:hypothetical protein BD779DRAFT_1475947 [Infundibulicybe gibba]|nr:hypothetical protein BD779DRAFT_1475947 [Infundibulicybe gibba]